jgi:cytochrome c553
MSAFAAPLTPQDMANLAAFYTAQQFKPSAAKNKDVVDLGRDIYRGGIAAKGVPSCAGCHGPTGSGIPSQYPRLGGQFAEYTEAQLVAFRSGARANNAAMVTIAARLSDHEIKALSDYIAGLR